MISDAETKFSEMNHGDFRTGNNVDYEVGCLVFVLMILILILEMFIFISKDTKHYIRSIMQSSMNEPFESIFPREDALHI